jgi:endoglycosylceramidase
MNQPNSKIAAITTCAGRFIDTQGRDVLLHGVNLVEKDPQNGFLSGKSPFDFQKIRSWGFNCVRLGVIWAGLEPQPGWIAEQYIEGVAQRVAWAKANDLYVILDMHQDLYSSLFSDGAPAWATLTGGAPHTVYPGVWSDAYFTSPAVQTALDNFWANAAAEDGIGLQDHYAACWQALARRFATEPDVIAYDLMNEPFPGSPAAASQMMLFARGAELLRKLNPSFTAGPEELAMQWLDPAGRSQLLTLLEEPVLYAQIIDVTQPVYNQFEREQLMPFFQRVANAIRAVDMSTLLFIETSMGSNMGVCSGVDLLLTENGNNDPAQAYAPHGYDLVVDTPFLTQASPHRVELIFNRHAATAKRLGIPMLVGEWGAFDRNIPGTLPAAWIVSRQFENHLCGDTYWHYEPDMPDLPPFQAISRPYPERVPGRLHAYGVDQETTTFDLVWEERPESNGSAWVFIPDWFDLETKTIQISPEGSVHKIHPGGLGAWLEILPIGRGERRLRII